MALFSTNTHDFCSKRKCGYMTGCLIFVLLMSQASCRPSETDDIPTYNDGDYTDADDIEWQNFPIVETTTKDHPIIYYKEDIVSEDYDPKKDTKSSTKEPEIEIKPLSRRRYKEISRHNRLNRTESYRYIKPEKVYFDVFPIDDDEVKEDDTKFNENDIHVEVISLVDNENNKNSNEENSTPKHLLNKRPKKFSHRHRQRRDVTDIAAETDETATHAIRHKRHPFSYRYSYYGNQLPQYRGVFYQPQVVIYPVKHTVKGIYHNALSPGKGKPNRRITPTATTIAPAISPDALRPTIISRVGEEDQPIWNSYPITTERPAMSGRPSGSRPTRRPPPPIIHSGDEDYRGSSSNQNTQMPQAVAPPSFGISSSASASVNRPVQQAPPSVVRTTTAPPPTSSQGTNRALSACIWAISSCCTKNARIRYQCFEGQGCSGAFWDLNPCADDIFRLALEAADQYLN